MIQDMVAETLKRMSSYLDLLALNWYHITQREKLSENATSDANRNHESVRCLASIHTLLHRASPNSLRISPSTLTTQKKKLLLFKRCHRPSLCTGLIKSSLVDKLLIQNLKKSLTLSTIAFLSCLASFPYVYFHTKRPLSLYQFLGGELRRISETIPCDYLPLPLRHVRPVQSQHEARVITLFLRVQELLYRVTSGVVA